MRNKTIASVFDEYTDIDFDKKFLERVLTFLHNYLNKNDAHILFYGGNLFGLHPIRFGDVHMNEWLDEVLQIDDITECERDLLDLDGIEGHRHVSGSIFNLSLAWTIHKFYTSKLKNEDRTRGVVAAMFIMQASHMAALQTWRFRYGADEAIAMAVYESYSKKTDLRNYGSWKALMEARGEALMEPDFVHKKALQNLETIPTVKFINDMFTRQTKMVNRMTEVYHEIKEEGARIQAQSKLVLGEDGLQLRDYSRPVDNLTSEMLRIATDKNNFLKDEIKSYVEKIVTTSDRRYIDDVLDYYVDNFSADKKHRELLEHLIVFIVNLARVEKIELSDIPQITSKILNLFRSSRSKNKDVLDMKRVSSEIVKKAIKRSRNTVQVSTQISLLLYLTLRILSIKKYE